MDLCDDIFKSLGRMPLPRWGYAIYRCAYANDAQWTAFLEILNTTIHGKLEFYGYSGLRLWDTLHWHIVEDRTLDGATKAVVRERFDEWVRGGADQPPGEQHFTLTATALRSRYCYCLHVDQGVLDAVVDGKFYFSPPFAARAGYVNFIERDYRNNPEVRRAVPRHVYEGEEEEEEEEDEDDGEAEMEPIEGDTNFDVGWMMVPLGSIAPYLYGVLGGRGDLWHSYYERPPKFPYM